MDSQCKQILRYMRTHEGISQRTATIELDCIRLGARIFDLREQGYNIITDMREGRNKTRYGFYILNEQEEHDELEI
jgi:hypothetical protein